MIKATYIDHMGSDLTIVNAARVSFGKKKESFDAEKDSKLIRYLARHRHTSPFGHCFASFHVRAPVFVARQLVKHKFLRWNEISRRYVDEEPEFYMPDVWRGRSADKKQGSEGTVPIDYIDAWSLKHIKDYWHKTASGSKGIEYTDNYMPEMSVLEEVKYVYEEEILNTYDKLLKVGVCPEQARMVLPQSMMTEWYWSGSLDAFADMCNLRLKDDTQYETGLVAEQIDQHMLGLFPIAWEALVYEDADE